jgi:hypothetical protein
MISTFLISVQGDLGAQHALLEPDRAAGRPNLPASLRTREPLTYRGFGVSSMS